MWREGERQKSGVRSQESEGVEMICSTENREALEAVAAQVRAAGIDCEVRVIYQLHTVRHGVGDYAKAKEVVAKVGQPRKPRSEYRRGTCTAPAERRGR